MAKYAAIKATDTEVLAELNNRRSTPLSLSRYDTDTI